MIPLKPHLAAICRSSSRSFASLMGFSKLPTTEISLSFANSFPYAVTNTIYKSGICASIFSKSSAPFICGMERSRKTVSGFKSANASNAFSGLVNAPAISTFSASKAYRPAHRGRGAHHQLPIHAKNSLPPHNDFSLTQSYHKISQTPEALTGGS